MKPGASFSKLSWDESLTKISDAGCAELYAALKGTKLSAPQKKNFCFYQVSYNYGDSIANQGKFDWSKLDSVKSNLDYASIPLGIVLDKTVEINSVLHGEAGKKEYIPTTLIPKGELFGAFEAINVITGIESSDPEDLQWNVTAGSRSIIINYPLRQFKDASTDESWQAVANIAKEEASKWKCEVLYFPNIFAKPSPQFQSLINCIIKLGWKQNQRVLAFNSFFDNALDKLARSCMDGGKTKFGDIFFWFFVRVYLAANNVRPGYVLVTEKSSNSLGPFPSALAEIKKSSSTWTPMLFEPCFLNDSKSGIYCSAYQTTIVGGLGRGELRNVKQLVATPIYSISQKLHNEDRNQYPWLSQQRFILIEYEKTQKTYHVRHGSDPLTEIKSSYKDRFAKLLVKLKK